MDDIGTPRIEQVTRLNFWEEHPTFHKWYVVRKEKEGLGGYIHKYLWPDGTWRKSAWESNEKHAYYDSKEAAEQAINRTIT